MAAPKKTKSAPKVKALAYGEQTLANKQLNDYFLATSNKNGLAARGILDDLVELLESAFE